MITELFIALSITFVVMIFSAQLVLFTNYKPSIIKKVYKELPSKNFYLNGNQVYTFKSDQPDDHGFVWFMENNSFKLKDGCYLHNNIPTYFSPYHFYWLKKYQKWAKMNLKIVEHF